MFQPTQAKNDTIFDINENLAKAAELSLRAPLDLQFIIMCRASENAAG